LKVYIFDLLPLHTASSNTIRILESKG